MVGLSLVILVVGGGVALVLAVVWGGRGGGRGMERKGRLGR